MGAEMDKKKITNMEVKKKNRNDVFRYLCKQGTAVSNSDIAYALKLSLPTVTQITKELIAKGLVEEKGELQSTGGRRAKALALSGQAGKAVGLDITPDGIRFVLTDLTGRVLNGEHLWLSYDNSDSYYREVNRKLEDFLDASGCRRERVLGIGISLPGIVDLKKQTITDSHTLGLQSVHLSDISRFFPYPCQFLNDANAAAYAQGLQAGHSGRFFYLSLSNTVGGAIYNGGRPEQGDRFRCGEAGHMTVIPDGDICDCGKRGCLNAYCSAKRLSDHTGGKLDVFFERLQQGEQEAVRLWDSYTYYLALAVNNIHMLLDCDIILGGSVGIRMGSFLCDVQEQAARRNAFAGHGCFLKPCSQKAEATALGASLKVIETFLEEV